MLTEVRSIVFPIKELNALLVCPLVLYYFLKHRGISPRCKGATPKEMYQGLAIKQKR